MFDTRWGLLALSGMAGCAILADALMGLSNLALLGVMPAPGFSDDASPDRGRVTLALGGEDGDRTPIIPPTDWLVIEDDQGREMPIEDSDEIEGHFGGSFVMLVDGSASVEATDQCDGCPTDPMRLRVDAVQVLSAELATCGDGWRQALMEFRSGAGTGPFKATNELASWSTDPEVLAAAADLLSSDDATPIWDSTWEVLDALVDDATAHGAETGRDGVGIVVMSDGADTDSHRHSLDQLIDHANALGVAVHAVGFGPASDVVEETDGYAVEDLRRLAVETGGYYGTVTNTAELPGLAEAIALAACGGRSTVDFRYEDPPATGEIVTGTVRVRDTSLAAPFMFRAP